MSGIMNCTVGYVKCGEVDRQRYLFLVQQSATRQSLVTAASALIGDSATSVPPPARPGAYVGVTSRSTTTLQRHDAGQPDLEPEDFLARHHPFLRGHGRRETVQQGHLSAVHRFQKASRRCDDLALMADERAWGGHKCGRLESSSGRYARALRSG
jgi:hypothetical protein